MIGKDDGFFDGDRFGGLVAHAYVVHDDLTLTTNVYGSIFYRDRVLDGHYFNHILPKSRHLRNLATCCGEFR